MQLNSLFADVLSFFYKDDRNIKICSFFLITLDLIKEYSGQNQDYRYVWLLGREWRNRALRVPCQLKRLSGYRGAVSDRVRSQT